MKDNGDIEESYEAVVLTRKKKLEKFWRIVRHRETGPGCLSSNVLRREEIYECL